VPEGSLARANAWYLASNCAGSLCGPVLMGLAIDLFGRLAQFGMAAGAIVMIVGVSLVIGSRWKPSPIKGSRALQTTASEGEAA
jgi:MFS-type transporter involved in bile tolerance (Atg22 family)